MLPVEVVHVQRLQPCVQSGKRSKFMALYSGAFDLSKTRMTCYQLLIHCSSSCFAEHACDQCPAVFKKKRALARHKANVHQKDKTWYCELCEKHLPLGYNGEKKKLHQKRKHGDPVECECRPVF